MLSESVVAVAVYKLRVVLTERSLTGLLATFLPKWKFSEYDPPMHEAAQEIALRPADGPEKIL